MRVGERNELGYAVWFGHGVRVGDDDVLSRGRGNALVDVG
jgi:hypothetical protein